MYTLTDADKAELMRVRKLHNVVAILRDGLRELELLSISLKSPVIDGMPKVQQRADADSFARTMARIEGQRQTLEREERSLRRAQGRARSICRHLDGSFRLFCMAYYADGEPFEVAQACCGVRERRCWDFKAMIEGKINKAKDGQV